MTRDCPAWPFAPPPAPGDPVRPPAAAPADCRGAPPVLSAPQRRRARIKAQFWLWDDAEMAGRRGGAPPGVPLPSARFGGFAHVQTCRRCGCDDFDCAVCIERTGEPCWWVEPDLCSACASEIGA